MLVNKVEFPTHKRPTTEASIPLMMLLGFALTALIYLALWPFKGSFVRDLFIGNAEGGGGWVGGTITFCAMITLMWALSTMTMGLKFIKIRKERSRLEDDLLPEDLDFQQPDQVSAVYQRVMANPDLKESIALTRLARILAVFVNTSSFARTVEAAKEEAELDAFVSDGTFRLNRLFIWALPVLGFIGTVYGVSLAVSNFAGFLQGAVTPEAIKVQVGLITTGLGVAFYTTLLGLVFATLAAFSSLIMERTEESMLESINELVEDRMILRMPTESEQAKQAFPVDEIVTAIREGLEGVTQQHKFPVEELAQAIDAGFRRLPNPDRYEEVFTRAITKASDLINQKYDEFATNYERRVAELGSQLGGKLEQVGTAFNSGTQRLVQGMSDQTQRLAQTLTDMEGRQTERMDSMIEEMRRLAQQMPEEFRKAQEKYLETQAKQEQKTADRFEELTEQIATMGKEQNEQFSEAHERYLEAIAELDKKEISRWEKMVAEFNQLAGKLAEQFRQAVASLDATTARYSDRVQESAQALSDQLQKVQQLGIEIDKVLRTTQSMETTLRQVGSSDEFRQTLSNLRTHLNASDELLKQLSKPRKVVFAEQRAED